MWKVNIPLASGANIARGILHNCRSLTPTCWNCCPLFHTQFFYVQDIWRFSQMLILKSLHPYISIGFTPGLLFFTTPFYNPSFLLFEPFLNGFACVLRSIIMLKVPLLHQPSDRWSHIIFNLSLLRCRIHSSVKAASCLVPGAVKQPQTIKIPPTHFTICMRFLSWKAVFILHKTCQMLLRLYNSIFNFAVQVTLILSSFFKEIKN